ncbi:Ribosome LSU-associated GTP-binding protein HflX, partial [hydrothermal vent metagenome]
MSLLLSRRSNANCIQEGFIKAVEGNCGGLKPSQLRALERLYRRKTPNNVIISPELGGSLCKISKETGRQIALLIDRRGKVTYVIVGDQKEIMIPPLSRARIGPGRLRGLRLVHTHLKNEPLSRDDLTDLALLRLDIVMAIGASETGDTESAYVAYLNPDGEAAEPWITMDRQDFKSFDFQFDQFIDDLEKELSKKDRPKTVKGELRAVLTHISNLPGGEAEERLAELTELCETENIIAI